MREAITYEIPYATTVVVNTAITSHNRCAMMAFAAWANPLVTEAGKIDSSMEITPDFLRTFGFRV